MQFFRFYIFILTCIINFSALAEITSNILFETSTNSTNGKDYYIGATIGFIRRSQFEFSYGKSYFSESTTQNYAVGIASDPREKFNTRLTYLYWQQKNEMETRTYQLSLNSNTDDWGFSFSPEIKIITIYPLTTKPFDTNSTGIAFSSSFYGFYPVYISARYKFYSYNRNVSRLDPNRYPIFTIRNFSPDTINQAAGLENNRISFDVGYDFSKLSIGYYFNRSISAVDNSAYTTNAVYGKWNFMHNWKFGIETGTSKSSVNATDATAYTRFSLSYN